MISYNVNYYIFVTLNFLKMESFYHTLIGYLNSARFLAYELDQPTMAKDLLKYEILEPGLVSLNKIKTIAKNERIELGKVWEENLTSKNNQVNSIHNYENMSERLKNILLHQKINNVFELANYTRYQALTFRNAGVKSIDELERIMFEHGVSFKDINS